MQKISFGNRDYVKASEVAKQFKYTQDYVGQLCRGDKVAARLVGRVWYVNLQSVSEYRKSKHASQKKDNPKQPRDNQKTKAKSSNVEPVIRAKTARLVQENFPRDAKSATKHISAKYSHDHTATIPVVDSGNTTPDKPASSKAAQKNKRKAVIKVRPNTKKSTSYYAEKIPEITLKSKVKVTSNVENLVPKTAADAAVKVVDNATQQESEHSKHTSPKAETQSSVSFHPKSVKTKQTKPTTTARSDSARSSRGLLVQVLVLGLYLVAVIGAATLFLGVAYFSETGSPSTTSGLMFSAEQAWEKIQEITR